MQQTTKDNLANRNIWARGLYMLFYVLAYAVAETILALVAIFQFIHTLFTGKVNEPLQAFSANLCAYIVQLLEYVTFNSEFQPFPFAEWPDAEPGETPWSEPPAQMSAPPKPVQEPERQATPDTVDDASPVEETGSTSNQNQDDAGTNDGDGYDGDGYKDPKPL